MRRSHFLHHRTLWSWVILVGMIALTACQDMLDFTGPEADVFFNLKVPISNNSPHSYALGVVDEATIATIDILLFDASDNYTYQPIYINENNITTDGSNLGTKSFSARLPVGNYKSVVFVVNARSSITSVLSSITKGENKASVISKIKYDQAGKWVNDPGASGYKPIPMWGEKSINVTQGISDQSITIIRTLSKVDVLVDIAARLSFQLRSVRLYNYNDKAQVAPTPTSWNGNVVTQPSVPADASKPASPVNNPIVYGSSEITSNDIAMENQIYTLESAAGTASTLGTNTCIVVGGLFQGESVETYYRLDFANGSNYLNLLRNHLYKVNIKSVTASGLPTPEDAFNSVPVNMTAEIASWNGKDVDVAFDGQCEFKVSRSTIDLDYRARTSSIADNKLTITTQGTGGWQLVKIVDSNNSNPGWLTLSDNTGADGAKEIYLKTTEHLKGSSWENRTVYVHLKAGNLTYVVEVNQMSAATKNASNCFMVKPNHTIIFDPTRGFWGYDIAFDREGPFTVELVWTDNANRVAANAAIKAFSKYGNRICVEAGSAQGNAVIQVRNASNQVFWAWHIWVTDYVPGSETFMDRNLGALNKTKGNAGAVGLLYQWGRPHPFPGRPASGTADPTIYNASGTTTITKVDVAASPNRVAFQNPRTFYRGIDPSFDWYTHVSGQSTVFWQSSGNANYGPCPEGWRVPTVDEYNAIKGGLSYESANNGFNHTTHGWFPTTGCRLSNTGSFDNDHINSSFYWTQNDDGIYASNMNFSPTNVVTCPNPSYRATAGAVRCRKQ